jgi:hypothetical protein
VITWTDYDSTIPDPSLNYAGPYCNAEQDAVCTRIPGHTGRHAAGNGDGYIVAVWPYSTNERAFDIDEDRFGPQDA